MNLIAKELESRAESAESALSLLTAKLAQCEEKCAKATEPGRRYEEWKEYMKLEGMLDNTATFCRRLAKALGSDHPISKATMQYLDENDLLQSPLREPRA